MFSLTLINKDQSVNHAVLRFILENEDEEFIDQIVPEIKSYTVISHNENGILYHIEFVNNLWVDILQNGTDYQLVACS